MLQDAFHYKTVLKVEEEDYIFIRRAISHQSKLQRQQSYSKKETLESDHLFLDQQ